MRFTRLIGALLAVVLMGALGLVTSSSASAADSAATATSARPATSERAALQVTAKAVTRGRSVYLVGKVKPRRGPVVIQRATRCPNGVESCNFKTFKKVGTNKKARFEVRTPSRAGGDYFYRARVGAAVSATYRVFRL